MVQFTPGEYEQARWDAWTTRFDGMSLLQEWSWGEAKAKAGVWAVERGTLQDDDGRMSGIAQVMVRHLPWVGGGLAWVARGPLFIRGEGESYPALLSALRSYYVEKRRLYLRVSPASPVGVLTNAQIQTAGFRRTGISGWASAALDLSASEETLRGQLAQKWRNGLNKAERAAVSVEAVSAVDDFTECLALYSSFTTERGFATTVTSELLARLQGLLPDERKMTWWRCALNGEQLGSALVVRYGDRCEYLVGTLTESGRKYNAGQILLWRALLAEKARGVRWFDVGGMDPDLTPSGIFNFKAGLGASPYRLEGEIEADDGSLLARLVRWRVSRARAASGALT